MHRYVTTPIYYPNDEPHMGHAYTTIAADILNRWWQMHGDQSYFLTGVDEHGKKIQNAAFAAGMKEKEFVDQLIPKFKHAWDSINVKTDRFIRTHDEDHQEVVQWFLNTVKDNGYIYKDTYTGLYCVHCEAYYTEKDAVDGRCPIHKTVLEKIDEESYFFKMSAFQERLLKHYEDNPDFVQPAGRRNEILSRIKEGLRDISISRANLKWGVPIPFDKNHVTYVWFDALPNYLTGIGFLKDKENYEKYWSESVHILGKDILWFHAVIWPCMLMAADLPLPKKMFAHGWWTVNNEKMGKSAGNAIKVPELISYAGVDPVRYFMFRETPFGSEGDFSKKNLLLRYETELANKYGNLASRLTNLLMKFGVEGTCKEDLGFANCLKNVNDQMENLAFHDVLSTIFGFIDGINEYVQQKQPWSTKDVDVLVTAYVGLKRATVLLHPFMPETTQKVANAYGFSLVSQELEVTDAQAQSPKEKFILFPKIEKEKEEPEKTDWSFLDLRVGKIVDIKKHPEADRLFVETIDLGDHQRQIVSGLAGHYEMDELLNKQVVVVCNLKSANLRGVDSQGMLLAAEHKKKGVGVVLAPKSNPGDKIRPANDNGAKDEITIEDVFSVTIRAKDGQITIDDDVLKTATEDLTVDKGINGKVR